MTQSSQPAILIAGPTASGKTALAVAIARQIGGVVVNADSMQVYADLSVLSARPGPDEQDGVEHVLFGHVDGAVNYSAGQWLRDATQAIAGVRATGRVPVVTGGTGLYFKALLCGLSDIPPVPEHVRQKVRQETAGRDGEALRTALARVDPVSAHRIGPADRQRLERALEVHAATGRPLSAFHRQRSAPVLAASGFEAVFLAPERQALYERIDRRFAAMVAGGAIEEARALAVRGLDPRLPVMRAHGVPGLLEFLEGAASLEAALTRGQADTRHYAKRQFTWFRHQAPDFPWRAPEAAAAFLLSRWRERLQNA